MNTQKPYENSWGVQDVKVNISYSPNVPNQKLPKTQKEREEDIAHFMRRYNVDSLSADSQREVVNEAQKILAQGGNLEQEIVQIDTQKEIMHFLKKHRIDEIEDKNIRDNSYVMALQGFFQNIDEDNIFAQIVHEVISPVYQDKVSYLMQEHQIGMHETKVHDMIQDPDIHSSTPLFHIVQQANETIKNTDEQLQEYVDFLDKFAQELENTIDATFGALWKQEQKEAIPADAYAILKNNITGDVMVIFEAQYSMLVEDAFGRKGEPVFMLKTQILRWIEHYINDVYSIVKKHFGDEFDISDADCLDNFWRNMDTYCGTIQTKEQLIGAPTTIYLMYSGYSATESKIGEKFLYNKQSSAIWA